MIVDFILIGELFKLVCRLGKKVKCMAGSGSGMKRCDLLNAKGPEELHCG